MPEMHYELAWPDGTTSLCYSPSLVIKDYFEPGKSYPLPDFMTRIREATQIASSRVEARYGFPCSRALGQLALIEGRAASFGEAERGAIQVLRFDEKG